MALTPQFSQKTIVADLQRFAKEQEEQFVKGLAFLGEEFVNAARSIRTYKDETGNLRSSIGYAIVKNGRVVSFKVSRSATEGKSEAESFVTQKVNEEPQKGIYLLVFAGMEYALYVEAKGYDVLSGSRPSRSQVLGFFKDLLAA
jgi:hypothetical protein